MKMSENFQKQLYQDVDKPQTIGMSSIQLRRLSHIQTKRVTPNVPENKGNPIRRYVWQFYVLKCELKKIKKKTPMISS